MPPTWCTRATYDAVGLGDEAVEGEDRVVRLHDDVAPPVVVGLRGRCVLAPFLRRIREDRVRLQLPRHIPRTIQSSFL